MIGNNQQDVDVIYLISATDYDCVTEVIQGIDIGEIGCGCNVECQEEDYTVSLSTSLWPSSQYFVRNLKTTNNFI